MRKLLTRQVSAQVCAVVLLLSATLLPSFQTQVVAQQRGAARGASSRATNLRRVPEDVLLRIVRAEDERRWDAADLGALLNDKSAAVRRRAALAVGRIGDEGAVGPLTSLLARDADAGVQAMAAFALGEIEAASASEALLNALRTNKQTVVRARAIEALGKIAAALPESQAARRQAIGAALIVALDVEGKLRRPDSNIILLGLTAALRARPTDAGRTIAQFLASTDPRVRADAANTLARLREKNANEQLRSLLAGDPDAVVRANVARALGVAEDKGSFEALISRVLADVDERVRVSAVRSLASLKDPRAASTLLQRGETLLGRYRAARAGGNSRPSEINEMLEVATTLGRVLAGTRDERAVAWLRAVREVEEWNAPEVEIAFARIAPSVYVRERPYLDFINRTGRTIQSLRWQAVSSLAQGLGEIASLTNNTSGGGNSMLSLQADAQMLTRLLLDSPQTPALAMPDVLRALAAFKPPGVEELLRGKLNSQDIIVRATVADLLSELSPDEATTRALTAALPAAMNDSMNDAALSILGALAKQKNAESVAALRSALEVPDYQVRRRAAALLAESGAGEVERRVDTVATRYREADYRRALARVGKRVRASIVTDKGVFIIELLPDDATLTVDNFVQLANSKFFDGVTFHRVVPNFVIQGGDPRGDGNGGPGYQIRCEINMEPYGRGAVGMALSGKDTGGSQWFVTHSPQPHLDGGYTVFGNILSGMDVVDRITRGDRIRSVTVTEGR